MSSFLKHEVKAFLTYANIPSDAAFIIGDAAARYKEGLKITTSHDTIRIVLNPEYQERFFSKELNSIRVKIQQIENSMILADVVGYHITVVKTLGDNSLSLIPILSVTDLLGDPK
jgi:hypothetical protein